jgi:cytoskeleton protein RodZ
MALFHRSETSVSDDPPAEAPTSSGVLSNGRPSAGDVLREQREALALGLDDAAAALRIKTAYLAALEAGRLDLLPGPTYAFGFARAYAEHLGLDSAEVLRRFRQEAGAFAKRPDLSLPMPLTEHSMPGGGMLLVAMILAICGYGTWYYFSTSDGPRPRRVAEVPAELLPADVDQQRAHPAGSRPTEASASPRVPARSEDKPPPPAPAGSAVVGSEPTGAVPPPPANPSPSPAPAAPQPAAASPPATVPSGTQMAALRPAPPPATKNSARRDVVPRVMIRATADSWVEIRGAGRSVLFTRTLKAGESCAVPDQPGLSMRTGNAGALEITVDGNPVPSIGGTGMVRRNVQLDPQALIAGTAVHN